MAKPLQTISIQAPAFYGLNTEDSPVELTPQFAIEATNCVVDKYGRIGARKGWTYETGSLGAVKSVFEYIKSDGTMVNIYTTQSGVFANEDPITPNNYEDYTGNFTYIVVSDTLYMYEKGLPPLYYDGTTCEPVTDHTAYSGTIPQGDVTLSAFGRAWVAEGSVVYWSDLLLGMSWDTGSSGSIDISMITKNVADEVTGLAQHNGFLIIFGRTTTLVYSNPTDPATMALADSVIGVGCVSHRTIQPTGKDLLFLSEEGLRSLGRTIQEKSSPLTDVSKNVRSELLRFINESTDFRTVYSPVEGFYLLFFTGQTVSYCFDVRSPLQDGSYRVTKWLEVEPNDLHYRDSDNTVIMAMSNGVARYEGYTDNGRTYIMSYFSNYLDFGNPSQLKMLKNIKTTLIGGSGTDITLNYGYDYKFDFKKKLYSIPVRRLAYFGEDEYGMAEYNSGDLVSRPSFNAAKGGEIVQVGVQAVINGNPLSIQRLTAQAILGRIV